MQKKYGLLTSIAMIVGIVIGSGIFFKSDDILVFTNNNVFLGVVIFCIAAVSIIFGSLSIAQLASKTDKHGGIITYAEKFIHPMLGCVLGWFQTFLYYPTIIVVVSWVCGIYTCQLFGIPPSLNIEVAIGLFIIAVLYALNILSAKIGGHFQSVTMIIKLIPLFLFAVLGMTFGNPSETVFADMGAIFSNAGWIAAIVPIAFSFDGWIVATSIGHEIKNSKRNLPLALIISPLIILTIYVAYFVGVTSLLGPEQVAALGNGHVDAIARQIFGDNGSKIILTFVIISVLGTVNGLSIGNMRMPYALSLRGVFPQSDKINHISEKYNLPIRSAFISFLIIVFWYIVHYLVSKFNLMPSGDISEISIVLNYVFFIFLYVAVIKLTLKGEIKNKFSGIVAPILATIGSIAIFMGGMYNPLFIYYIGTCLIVVAISILYYYKNKSKQI